MLLPPDEAALVHKLHRALMQYVNERLNVVGVPGSVTPYATLSEEKRLQVVQAFVGRLELIDAFIAANPAGLSHEELEIVSSWRHLVSGHFIALRQFKRHMILLSCEGTPTAYGVLGLVDPFERLILNPLPAMVEIVLLPFRGKITYDGLICGFNVTFGPGSRRAFEQQFRETKAANRVLTSLTEAPADKPRRDPPRAQRVRAPRPPIPPPRRVPTKVVRSQAHVPASISRRLFQFRITLRGVKPPVWRRIQVLDDTLDRLHEHIQMAMGWTNSHLHQFFVQGQRCGDPDLLEDGFEPFVGLDSTRTLMSAVLPEDGTSLSFEYDYDFGDSWEHEILFEGSPPRQSGVSYPQCLEGERACPPEDVGGIGGYAEYLEAMANPRHKRHRELLAWRGPFNPNAFNPRRATHAMQEGMPNWRNLD